MTVEYLPIIQKYEYTGLGDYPFNFYLTNVNYVKVSHEDTDGNIIALSKDINYQVVINSAPALGGKITVTTFPETGGTLIVERKLPIEQQTEWSVEGHLKLPKLELSLDEVVMMIQQIDSFIETQFFDALRFRGNWSPNTVYEALNIVVYSNNYYMSKEDFTSGSAFDSDNWSLILDMTDVYNAVSAAAQSEANAKVSEDNAKVSEDNAKVSEDNASDSEANALVSSNMSSNCAASALESKNSAKESADAAEAIVAIGERADAINTDYYTATAGQTDFTITNASKEDNVFVFMNSRKLRRNEEYTLDSPTSAVTMTLAVGADAGDEIDIVSFNTFEIASLEEAVTAAEAAQAAAEAARDAAQLAQTGAEAAEAGAVAAVEDAVADAETLLDNAVADATEASAASAASASASAASASQSATNADGSADLAEQYALDAQSVACQDLASVYETLLTSSNVVDVFIYDTTGDSDGGAWRKRCQGLSWYNEPLNTSTRGATREFPAIAFIVAESNKVTIFDGTDPSLPMWMVFYSGGGWPDTYSIPINNISSVVASNGVVVVGCAYGVNVFNFLTDRDYIYGNTGIHSRNVSLEKRNIQDVYDYVQFSNESIADSIANDVAVAVLDEAPISQETGLPIPTIAVATDGGVSIIDGPAGVDIVVDITPANESRLVVMSKDRLAFSYGSSTDFYNVGSVPATTDTPANWRKYYIDNTTVPALLGLESTSLDSDKAVGHAEGLTKLKENPMSPEDGMTAFITDEYSTGWMKGDIKLATLADTTAEAIGTDVVTELVENGDFDDTVGWTLGTGWTVAGGVVSCDGTPSNENSQEVPITGGKKYIVSFTISGRTTGATRWYLGSTSRIGDQDYANNGDYQVNVTAGSDTLLLMFKNPSTFDGSIDNVSVVETEEKVINGTFDTDSDWSLGVGWSITGGSLVNTGGANGVQASQGIATVIGEVYSVVAECSEVTGTVNINARAVSDGGTALATVGVTSVGTTELTFKAISTSTYITFADYCTSATFDNISVTPVNNVVENGEFSSDRAWTKGTGWSIAGGVASCDGSQTVNSGLYQLDSIATTGKYLIKYTVSGYTAGQIRPRLGSSGNGTWRSANGAYTEIISSTGNTFNMIADVDFIGSIDNVTVEEVTLVDGQYVVNGELVENGQFEGLTDGWTANDANIYAIDGRMEVSTIVDYGRATTPIQTVAGEVYQIAGNIVSISGSDANTIAITSLSTGSGTLAQQSGAGSRDVLFTFKETVTGTRYISCQNNSTFASVHSFDNISVKRSQNLVENGEFSSDRAWTKGTGWSIAGGVASCDGSQTGNSSISQSNVFDTIGAKVRVVYTLSGRVSGSIKAYAGSSGFGTSRLVNGTYSEVLTVTDSTIFLLSATSDFIGSIDNVVVEELQVPDRSVNDNPLQVVGQLEKTPVATGSELVAYGPFSLNGYLEQPYNADLDFGTGDFYMCAWIKDTAATKSDLIVYRSSGNTATYYGLVATSSNVLRFQLGSSLLDGTIPLSTGKWRFVVGTRKDGVRYTYVDGVLDATSSGAANVDDVDAKLTVGSGPDGGSAMGSGSLSLARIGAGSPSPEQIKHMYDTEKHLFQEDAKCTLTGTDSGVNALSYDSEQQILSVATDSGISQFKDLLNVDDSPISGGAKVIDSNKGSLLTGTGTDSEAYIPPYQLREELEEGYYRSTPDVPLISAGVGQTSIKCDYGYKPRLVYDAGLLKAHTVTFDGFHYYASIAASTGDVTIIQRRI